MENITLRDYFIAHAPAEPQPWFEPKLPEQATPLPLFTKMYPDYTEDELRAYRDFDSDWMVYNDVKEERVRNYLFQKEHERRCSVEYSRMAERERYIQWPSAWADAMIKEREKYHG